MALSKAVLGCGAVAGVALLSHRMLKQSKSECTPIDSEAAFPTAQLVAAMRAMDARSDSPLIGSNIGGGPDRAAEVLAGDLGFEFLKEMGNEYSSLVSRTMFFDDQWMKALDAGCKQFVILAAGLDARAWRLPRLDKSVKVFEVDVPRAMAYKEEKIAQLGLPCDCTRITVQADLSDPQWKQQLLSTGFDPTEQSFFLIEGLLMYLPPEAPQALLQAVSSLMKQGSTITGDAFVNVLQFMDGGNNPVLAKYGTKWTFDFASKEALLEQLSKASFQEASVRNIFDRAADDDSSVDKVRKDANRIAQTLKGVAGWPAQSKAWVRVKLAKENGAQEVIREIVDDKMGFQGLKEESPEHKGAICELLFAEGCDTDLEAAFHGLPALDESWLSKIYGLYQGIKFLYQLKKYKAAGGSSGYMLYVAAKA